MEGHEQRCCWRRYEVFFPHARHIRGSSNSGPAHAVYFGTYEVVKEFAGGNAADGKHHPLAAGTYCDCAIELHQAHQVFQLPPGLLQQLQATLS
jgi:hypothetical protein